MTGLGEMGMMSDSTMTTVALRAPDGLTDLCGECVVVDVASRTCDTDAGNVGKGSA